MILKTMHRLFMKLKQHDENWNVDGFVVGLFMVSTKRMTSGERWQKQGMC
jgi:hypothetical protein